MRFDILTLFPHYFDTTRLGVTGRAFTELGHSLYTHCYRPHAGNAHGHVDDTPFGGGPGMVLRPDVLQRALGAIAPRFPRCQVIHFTPAAPPLTHQDVLRLAEQDQLILICTRYEGVDRRAIERYVDAEYSIGEVVLSGGELPALFLIDAVCRWLPDVLGNQESAPQDSFATGLLDHPHYTRPHTFEGEPVPAVLTSGDHQAIRLWRLRQAMALTQRLRPDLWRQYLQAQLPTLDRPAQWCAWQVEHAEDADRPKPKGWKGWKR